MTAGGTTTDPARSRFILERYRALLPVGDATPMATLGEGGTPLVRMARLEREAGVGALYLKLESLNPTGSFKDRGMVVAVAKAVEDGAKAVICASTGNTSASAAAYAALHGLRAFVVVPAGRIAMGKLAQAVVHGAEIVSIDGSFDAALRIVRELAERHSVALVNSVNPHRIAGQKTAAFEVADELGDAPDVLCIPVGNAGNITAYWRGFSEYYHLERSSRLPRMWGFQAMGAAPLVLGHRVEHPETIATAIRIGNPASWDGAIDARDASGGAIDAVTDEEILEAYRRLANEGVFCEPASAASVAGLLKRASTHDLSEATVVCVITGSGLKDPDTALKVEAVRHEAPAQVDDVERALGWD
ncbi:MAG: threonine synthase [Chloroflexi bacterium]|nr:threonine synthase [Chloroflexota bacterium]MDA1004081.1 threonine synthase [Chloroflexota bacterium]MQC27871.1 threonine synthase [Chloroflexota bacterium]